MKTFNTAYLRHLLSAGCIVAALALSAGGCGKSDIEAYGSKDKLWFTQTNSAGQAVNKVVRSFSHFPGSATLDVPFQITLIGAVVDYDREYRLVVVDSLTTAEPSEYEVLPTVFRAGREVDTTWVKIIKSPRMDSKEVTLTLYIVENGSFEAGYNGRLSAAVTFNNITTKPSWWTDDITLSYMGDYSKEKFEAFYAYSGLNTIEGILPSDLRKLLLGFRIYIRDNDLREADGSPIEIPIH